MFFNVATLLLSDLGILYLSGRWGYFPISASMMTGGSPDAQKVLGDLQKRTALRLCFALLKKNIYP